jgi:hypothetical protein
MKESLVKQIDERNEEIGVMEKEIRELRGQVNARLSVRQSLDDSRKNNGDACMLFCVLHTYSALPFDMYILAHYDICCRRLSGRLRKRTFQS